MREDSADYFTVLANALDRLHPSSADDRRAVYDRMRKLLIEHVRLADPPWDLLEIVREQRALEAAIEEVELEYCLLQASRRPMRLPPPARRGAPHRPRTGWSPRGVSRKWIWIAAAALLVGLAAFAWFAAPRVFVRAEVPESEKQAARDLIERGDDRIRAGDFDRAIESYSEAIRRHPANVAGFNNRAYAHWSKGEVDRAIADYSQALRVDRANVVALGNRAVAYNRKGEYVLAIRDLDEAIRLQPENSYSWNSRCWGRMLAGELEAALADCSESLRLRPGEPNALDSRGLVHLMLGRLDPAIADFDAALKQDPKLVGSLYGRGLAKLRKRDAGGNADIEAAKAIKPDIAEEFARRGLR